MSRFLIIIALAIFAFLWGGIPTGYVVVKLLKGEDIRNFGSGNIGATNVRRVLGMRWFFGVLLLDAFKGAVPMLLAWMIPDSSGLDRVVAAACAIGGSLFSPWLGFRGGKGIGTSLGALFVIAPFPMLASIIAFIIILFAWNYVSIASLIAALIFPVSVFVFELIRGVRHDTILLIFSVIVAFMLIVMHRANLLRVANGTEPKFFARNK
jgi:acyl phosphate:glycerol-3-phosphate acyltransferase